MRKIGVIVLMISVFFVCIGTIQAADVLTITKVKIPETRYASLVWVFRQIQDQSGLLFVYQPHDIEPFTNQLIPEGTYTVQQLLDTAFRGTPLGYEENTTNIIVYKRLVPFTVKGRVIDSEIGEPLFSVSIVSEDRLNSTVTDEDGNFSIEVTDNTILIFSHVGRGSKKIQIHSAQQLNVSLDAVTLEAVTINTGYYTVPNMQGVGNISTTSMASIKRTPATNPLQSIQGRMPGVFVEQMSGIPGSGYTMRIRGRNSLREEGNNPLYIIDGVPYPALSLSSLMVSGNIIPRSNPLNAIDPASIERIDILKDADATAIYGSRGTNGVVLITTKRANKQGFGAETRIYSGIGQVAQHMELLSSPQWILMRREAFRNDEAPMTPFSARDLLRWDTTRYTDWQDKLIGGTARITNANMAVYGGEKKTIFVVRGDYRNETTPFIGNDFNYMRAATLLNLEHKSMNDRVHLSLTSNYSHEETILPVADLTAQAITLPPVAPPLQDPYGDLNWQNNTWINPLVYTIQTYESKTSNLILNNSVSYRILPGLQIRANLGYNMIERDEARFEPLRSNSPSAIDAGVTGRSFRGSNKLSTIVSEPRIIFSQKIGQGRLKALVGVTYQRSLQQGETIFASGFTSDAMIRDQRAATHMQQFESLYSEYKYAALFSRVNYTWGNRYIVNVTARRDGSSRFGAGNRFATFGAIGTGWIFTNEAFADSWKGMSFGKIRFSYGTTGSDQIDDYGYLGSYKVTTNSYDGSGIIAARPENTSYSWELNRKLEVGVALGFVKNRIQLDVSYYRNRLSSQLLGRAVPEYTGVSSVQYNVPATVQNSGCEVLLSTTQINNADWAWTTTANFTLPYNKLVRYDDLDVSDNAGRYAIGSPIDIKMLYQYTGINPMTGTFTFRDRNNDGRLSFADSYPVRYGPKFYGGIDNVIRYRRFELSFLFQFIKQTRQDLIAFFPVPGQAQNQPVKVMQRWQKIGDDAPIHRFTQRADVSGYSQGVSNGDMIYADASYVRLKSAALYYKAFNLFHYSIDLEDHTGDIKIFVMGQNLITITGYQGLDPESLDPRVLPPLRIITAGFEIAL
jgi:TonB-linked SusC/RagA family outer membrane protein